MANGRDAVRFVLQRDVVGDDVAVQMFEQFLARLGLRVEQKMILEAEQIHVAENAALRVQEERVAALARLAAVPRDWWSWRAAAARDPRR